MLDIEAIRADFPILDRVLPNGKNLVYFDNAATSQKPKCVIDAMSKFYENYNSSKNTIINATRYGNVIGSRGSVIPLFIEQILNNKPITITNSKISTSTNTCWL